MAKTRKPKLEQSKINFPFYVRKVTTIREIHQAETPSGEILFSSIMPPAPDPITHRTAVDDMNKAWQDAGGPEIVRSSMEALAWFNLNGMQDSHTAQRLRKALESYLPGTTERP